jgi:type VII secretion-associated serine protease mycosin
LKAHLRRIGAAATSALVVVVLTGTPALADSIRGLQWHLTALDITAVHRINQGDGVTVAVIDSGVNGNHPDLTGNVVPGTDLIATTGTGTTVNGWTDVNGHGTGMAGLIAAHGHGPGRKDGALGIAPHAKILPIRDGVGLIFSGSVPDGIEYAIQHGVKVISISAGTGTSAVLKQAIQDAEAHDIVVIAAAGNRPGDASIAYPARYAGVIAAGATSRTGTVATVSVTGPEVVLTAPGDDIATTGHTGYDIGTGTSYSTAIIAGAVALVRSKYPHANAAEVIQRLTATATDKGAPGRDPEYGYGVLNLVAALTATNIPAASTPAGPPISAAATPAAPVIAAPTANASAGPTLRLTTGFYVAAAILAFLVIAGGALTLWLLAFRRRT